MQPNIKYYAVEGWGSVNHENEIKSPIKIAAIPNDSRNPLRNQIGHNSISHLKKYDQKWIAFSKTRYKLANRICEEKYIIRIRDYVVTPYDKVFNEYSFDILQHSIHGKYNDKCEGIHLFTNLNKDITQVEVTKPEDKNGVWEAKVLVFNKKRNKQYEKISTFFPKSWSPDMLMTETFHAIKGITLNGIDSVYTKYKSNTLSGIPVIIGIKNKRLKSIYPLHQGE